MQMISVGENVIVEVMPKNNVTESGIVIPDNAFPESFLRGKVISIAENLDIKKDDIIAFSQHGGQDMLSEGKVYKVLKYGEVYCILRKEKKTEILKFKKNKSEE